MDMTNKAPIASGVKRHCESMYQTRKSANSQNFLLSSGRLVQNLCDLFMTVLHTTAVFYTEHA